MAHEIKKSNFSSIFEVDEFKKITNELKKGLKLQDISSNENLLLNSIVMISFINYTKRVDIPKKIILDVTVLLLWVDVNIVEITQLRLLLVN